MKSENKRNTTKEKAKENKRFPYKGRINQIKWKITNDDGKEYGKFIQKVNAKKEIKRLSKELFIEDLGVEEIRE